MSSVTGWEQQEQGRDAQFGADDLAADREGEGEAYPDPNLITRHSSCACLLVGGTTPKRIDGIGVKGRFR